MRTSIARLSSDEQVFSAHEIARAADVPVSRVLGLLRGDGRNTGFATRQTAIRLVQQLGRRGRSSAGNRLPLSLVTATRRKQGVPLFLSGAFHILLLLGLVGLTSGLLDANDTDQEIREPERIRLVYFMSLGPGGGGGGGGMNVATPPARIERKAPRLIRRANSPVPPPRKVAPPKPPDPPKPVEPPMPVEPPKVDPPRPQPRLEPPASAPPSQAVQAPVAPRPADQANRSGVLDEPPSMVASAGPGNRGGAGTGTGGGLGEGRGPGIGPGSGGGIGGGPFQPGAGIEPPSLVREIKPLYTDDARRRGLEGDVLLEIVVRRDGSVGSLRVIRRLGGGLDERAVEAVRQWRFAPARRQGAPVDVIVEVSVEFKLR